MTGLSDLFGRNGVLEQLVIWNGVSQAFSAALAPDAALLQQDMFARQPVQVIDPATAADLAARGIITVHAAEADAARSGLDTERMTWLRELHTVRLPAGDLAAAVLRSYLPADEAAKIARLQGVDATSFAVLTDLAGEAPGPQELAAAQRRGLLPAAGRGPEAVSYEQGIAESRLHDKWAPVIAGLSETLLSPADAASAVVRNFLPDHEGVRISGMSGVPADLFRILVHLSGDAPGPQQLAEALRRGLVPATGAGAQSTSFEQGIAEGRLADKWAPVIQGLAKLWPSPTDALEAQLKGQIPAAEGRKLYERLGGDLAFHDWLLATIGDSPTPLEAAALAARGIIAEHGTGPAVLSYEQAVKESRYRDKWGPAYRRLAEHIPPPSTITSMLAHRQLDEKQAHELLLQNDMSSQLAAAYIGEAEYEAVSDYRGITQTAVIDMYIAHVIDHDQATQLLEVLHVTPQAASLLLAYADLHYVIDSVNRSVQRIAALFTGRKISVSTAEQALTRLGIPAHTIGDIIGTWELQAAANVKTLTQAQIIDAWYYSVITQEEAITDLGATGYTPYDAWVLLSNKAKGPLPGRPPRIVAKPPGAVLPGVT